jgi:hypothetical protein
MKFGYQLSDVYQKFFPKELWQAQLQETKATCDQCNWPEYRPDLKCCTYEPFLPNYLVGALLSSTQTHPSARQALLHKIEINSYALPIGMVASPRFQIRFNRRKANEFGQREDWLCPYFVKENQNCGVWKYRGAVCTTYYCQSSFGVMGTEFWKQMSDYLTYVEMALMEEALVQLDFSPRQISDCLGYLNRQKQTRAEAQSDVMPEAVARKIWNGYFEDRVGFYKKTYDIVKSLSESQFREALGELGDEIEGSLMESLQEVLLVERTE